MTVRNITLVTGQRGRDWFTLAKVELEWTERAHDEEEVCHGNMTTCMDHACTLNGAITEECSDTEYIESFAKVEQCLFENGLRNELEAEEDETLTISAFGSCQNSAALLSRKQSKTGVRVGGYIALAGVFLLLIEICRACSSALLSLNWLAPSPATEADKEDEAFLDTDPPSLALSE